jgi:CPA2 family monovalent cation:H+ antiporter-2
MGGLEFIRDLAVVLGVAGMAAWLCQRVGLSLVVGYLAAGAIVGPFTPPFQFVTDVDRVQLLAQVGLIFLIFSIGLDLSFARLRRLGLPVILATIIGAVLVFNGCRLFGALAGWTHTQSLFLAGIMMVSSSAIISKVLQELNATHRRDGQLALGITVMEDTVAVVMLTVLATLVQFGAQKSPPVAQVVGGLAAFIILLVLGALFVMPRLLGRLSAMGRPEIRTIVVIAILLFLAWLAQKAGYSTALGAFLLGVVVASTPQKQEIERVFEGLRDMFGAVFFVAIGMLVDFHLLLDAWPLVLGVTAFALFLRPLATGLALIVAGNETRDSVRAGLSLTPLGEFSFIIAQLGVAAGAVPASFFPTAVGASLLTTLVAPSLMRRSGPISAWVDRQLPLMLREWIAFYQSWLERMISGGRQRGLLWRLTSRRLGQIFGGIVLISALVLFARPLFGWVRAYLGEDWVFKGGTAILFWTVFGVLVLGPLVAIWRNVGALSLIVAERVAMDTRRPATVQPLLERALRGVSAILLVLWLLSILPFGRSVLSGFLVVLVIVAIVAALLWRRLIFWQSKLEIELRAQLKSAVGETGGHDLKQLLNEQQDVWELQAEEYTIPNSSAMAGKRIGELALRRRLGCSIASIDRHGVAIVNPSAEVVLYPQDKLLLLGSAEQIDRAIAEFGAARSDAGGVLQELSLETLRVPEHSPVTGKTLLELDLVRLWGVQVAGIQRHGKRILTPSGMDTMEADDTLLILGTTVQINAFEAWLNGSQVHTAN